MPFAGISPVAGRRAQKMPSGGRRNSNDVRTPVPTCAESLRADDDLDSESALNCRSTSIKDTFCGRSQAQFVVIPSAAPPRCRTLCHYTALRAFRHIQK